MKKNMLTVVIAATSVINLILLIVIVFSVVPAMNKTNNLITKVATLVDLELDATGKTEPEFTYQDAESSDIAFENKQTINLQPVDGDSTMHYAMLDSISVTFNKNVDGESDIKASIDENSEPVQRIVKESIGEFTIKTINQKQIEENAIAKLKEYYKTKSIVSLSFGGFLYQ